MNLTIGKPLPPFDLETDTGDRLSSKSLKGESFILYFYPKDDTTGCTKEACDFRDSFPRFKKSKARILGISPDSAKKHAKFKAKYDLPFTLLVDEDHKLAESYGLWVEKIFYGRKYMGIARTTIVVGPDGKVQHVFEKVDPAGHADEVMAFLTGGIAALEKLKPAPVAKPVAKKTAKAPAKKEAAKKSSK
jgi:peroxiredoxin Q/BCP